ncbi:hypothetical protein CPB83DRAFT_856772 [Crepidotus variabilis]|uniref:RNI-like protein n=1 Tax=Crepidotus variabilis TaxID=179855 RepID=A0A9P6EDM4_9AGAR|nr:hypothetical protein CPB83DRAFT_856772 [Crepidotus variabilis]
MTPKRRKGTQRVAASLETSSAIGKLSKELLSLVFEQLLPMTMEILKNTPKRKSSPGSFYRDGRQHAETSYGDGVILGGRSSSRKKSSRSPEVVKFTYYLHQLRRVSKLWKTIIETMPQYHSRIVFWLNDPALSSVPALKTQLNKARNIPLDVFVSRRNEEEVKDKVEMHSDSEFEESLDADADEEAENTTSREVMNILAPFVRGCCSFVFKVKYSSSLPLLSRDFRGDAKQLRRLELSCEIVENSRNSFNPKVLGLTKKSSKFTFPRLTTLVMDGNTFMDACLTPTWLEQLKKTSFDSLSIYGLSPPDPDEIDDSRYEGFDLYQLVDVLTQIKHIRYLTLDSLGVGYEDGEAADNARPINVDSISLLHHDPVFIMEFLLATFGSPPYCFYHLCGTELDFDSVPRAHHLRLEQISNADSDDFIKALTRHWGDRLDLVDCENLTDVSLEWIADNCEHIRRIYIQDCPNITIKGLKALVERRVKLMAEKGRFQSQGSEDEDSEGGEAETVAEVTTSDDQRVDSLWGDSRNKSRQHSFSYKPFHRLQMVGHTAKLSSADRKWFQKHVDKFFWK